MSDHPEIDRYIRRATKGLWGRQRRDVALELRGAIDDKIWRHQLAGCAPDEAIRRALHDLGKPTIIARGMSAVYTVPVTGQVLGLLGLLAALSLAPLTRGLAQVTAVPLDLRSILCGSSSSTQRFRTLNFPADQLRRLSLDTPDLRSFCDRASFYPYEFVDRDSLLHTLTAGGVQVQNTPPPALDRPANHALPNYRAWRWLKFPDSQQAVTVVAVNQAGRQLVDVPDFMMDVLATTALPVQLEGEVNPRVTVGTVSFTLGTRDTPISANLLRTASLERSLEPILDSTRYAGLSDVADPAEAESRPAGTAGDAVTLHTSLPDGTLVGVLLRERQGPPPATAEDKVPEYLLYVTRSQQGQVRLLGGVNRPQTTVTDSFQDLGRPFAPGIQRKAMLMRLEQPDDLRDLSYQPLRTADVH